MKNYRKTGKVLLEVFTAAILLVIVTLTEGAISDDNAQAQLDFEAEFNRAITSSLRGEVKATGSSSATVGPEDFDDPLTFDFSDLEYMTQLGPGYPNPYADLGIEFMGRIVDYDYGKIEGHHLATGSRHSPPEPYVVRVSILKGEGALRVGAYVWPECGPGASITAFDDADNVIASEISLSCPGVVFMGVASACDRPIRYVEWHGLAGAELDTFPRVDHVMIDLCTCASPPEPNDPSPADGETNVPVDTSLSWKVPSACERYRFLAGTGGLDPTTENPFSLVELMTDPVREVRVGSMGFVPRLDFSPNGLLYGYKSDNLAIVNPDDGSTELACGPVRTATGASLWLKGIAFHPDGRLYGVADDGSEIVFYTIDAVTCIATEACRIPSSKGFVWGIDFSPDGVLYGAFGHLLRIDLTTCQASRIGPSLSLPWVTDIDWAPDGFLYGVEDETNKLHKIDPSTGLVVQEYGPYDSELWGVASQCLNGVSRTASVQTASANATGNGRIAALESVPASGAYTAEEADASWLSLQEQLARDTDRRYMLEVFGSRDVKIAANDNPVDLADVGAAQPWLLAAAQQDASTTCDVYLDAVNPPVKLVCQDLVPPGDGDMWTCNPGILEPGMTYYWKVVVKNACGATSDGAVWSFTTKGPIFADTFPSETIDSANWLIVSGATVDDTGWNEPSSPYSLRLNAYPDGGDLVVSHVLDLSGHSKVSLGYSYQRTGGGESPETEDDLIIEYYNCVRWVELDRRLGSGPDMAGYETIVLELPGDALTSCFQLRIRSVGTGPGQGFFVNDDWFVDDITLCVP